MEVWRGGSSSLLWGGGRRMDRMFVKGDVSKDSFSVAGGFLRNNVTESINSLSSGPGRSLPMKDWRNKYQIPFITLISFWGLFFPTYCLFYSLDEVRVFCRSHWENPLQEELLADVQDVQDTEEELIGSGWNFSLPIGPSAIQFLKLLSGFSLNPLIERVPILRC